MECNRDGSTKTSINQHFTCTPRSEASSGTSSTHVTAAPFIPIGYQSTTFWTLCNRCMMLFECLIIYLNQNVPCPFCLQPFVAMQMPAPTSRSSRPLSLLQPNLSAAAAGSSGFTRVPASGVSRAAPLQPSDERPKKSVRMPPPQIGLRALLMKKAKTEILGLLNESEAEQSKKSSDSYSYVKTGEQIRDVCLSQKSATNDEDEETVSMMVPDANFHNFDNDRIEVSFSKNQVWAAYDDDDGMPRYYALIRQVTSRKPFKMEISWLNSRSSSEFGPLNWIGSGLTKTCGVFRVGKCVVANRLTSFSHPVKWTKGARGAVQILPSKGDVWAVYRDWSWDWVVATTSVEATTNKHRYDVVVVLDDYNEDAGAMVAPLVKQAGFTSVFNVDEGGTYRMIPREEMFRFSHQVPFRILSGLEAENAPKGCYELDPAALPLELLEVIVKDAGKS